MISCGISVYQPHSNTRFAMTKRSQLFLLPLFLMLLTNGCKPASEGIVMTVSGPIDAADMGTTLTHEHVLVDFIGADSTGEFRWNKKDVVEAVTPYLEEIRGLNIRTLIECTPAYIGRDPEMLKMLSGATGMQLITNTGYYGAQNNKFLPASFYDLSAAELASLWTGEFENGIGESGVRPGFIKIAVNPGDTLSAEHEKIVAAAALAHLKTGLVIASHTGPDKPAFAQLKVLEAYGVDPSAFIWVHAQGGSLEGNIQAARSGAWISLDNVNLQRAPGEEYSTGWYAERILALKEAGLLDRVLISHDAGWYSPGEENGGSFRGFTDISTGFIPLLEALGFTPGELDQLLITNPRRAFTIRNPA